MLLRLVEHRLEKRQAEKAREVGKREQDEAMSTIKFDKKSFKIRSWIRGNVSLLPNKEIDNLVFQKMSVLASCFTCKEKVSRNAEVCPHCGEPNPVKN